MYMLLRLNGAYDSNSFQELAYRINGNIRGKAVEEYRQVFDDILREAISERKIRSIYLHCLITVHLSRLAMPIWRSVL